MKHAWGAVNKHFGMDVVFTQAFRMASVHHRFKLQFVDLEETAATVHGTVIQSVAGLTVKFGVNDDYKEISSVSTGERRVSEDDGCLDVFSSEKICLIFRTNDDPQNSTEVWAELRGDLLPSMGAVMLYSESSGTPTSTEDCLKLLVNAKASCASFLNGGTAMGPQCFGGFGALMMGEMFGTTDCRCNKVIQQVVPVGWLATDCVDTSTYEYQCEESDQIVDFKRFGTIRRIAASTKMPMEEMVDELNTIFEEDSELHFIGGGVYHGKAMTIEYVLVTNPTIADGTWVWGPTLEFEKIETTSSGLRTAALSELLYFTDPAGSEGLTEEELYPYLASRATITMVMGRWCWYEFTPCSEKVKMWSIGIDTVAKDNFFYLQSKLPRYNEKKYCQSLMDYCTGDHAQFQSYEECLYYNDLNVPVEDTQCVSKELTGLGQSKLCRILHQHMLSMQADHCYHTGLGGIDPHGGAHCFENECSGTGGFTEAELTEHFYWMDYYGSLGTHECIDGIWYGPYHKYTWSKSLMKDAIMAGETGTTFECLILGEESYMKLYDADAAGIREFHITYAGYEIDGSFKQRFVKDEHGWKFVSKFTIGDAELVDYSISLGSSRCISLMLSNLELCVIWGAGDITYFDDVPPLGIFLKVDGEETSTVNMFVDEVSFLTMDDGMVLGGLSREAALLGDAYQSKDAETKLDILMNLSREDTTSSSWNTKTWKTLFRDYFVKEGETQADIMPVGHSRYAFRVGAVLEARFEWAEGASSAGYTGLFEKAYNCIVRMSSVDDSPTPNIEYGMAVKCLRDGVPSANTFAIWDTAGFSKAPEGYMGTCRLFSVPLFTHYGSWEGDAGKESLESLSGREGFLSGLSQFATYTQEGETVDQPRFPFGLLFVPTPEAQSLPCSWGEEYEMTGKNFDFDNFLSQALNIEAGMGLYEVYAVGKPWIVETEMPDISYLGVLRAHSQATSSRFGDELLFFQTDLWDKSVSIYPEWDEALGSKEAKQLQSAKRYAAYLGFDFTKWRAKLPVGTDEISSSTAACVKRLAILRPECVSVFSGGQALSPVDCYETIQGESNCRCNSAIRSLVSFSGTPDCDLVDTFEYGCTVSDMAVDALRLQAIKRFKAALSTSFSELEGVIDPDAALEFFGIGKYVGGSEIWKIAQMMNTNSGPLTLGQILELTSIDVGATGFNVISLEQMSAFSDVLKAVQGSFKAFEFKSCTGTITAVSVAVDDFTFKTLTVLQPALPQYNEKKYCKTLMQQCTGEASQFVSYEECVTFNEESVPLYDKSCGGLVGFGNGRFCRMVNQYMVTSDDAESCANVGLGGGDSSTCGAGTCSYRTLYNSGMLLKAKDAISSFLDLGSHECIDGIWKQSEYLYKWSTSVADSVGDGSEPSWDCLVLGKESYFKLVSADDMWKRGYELKYSSFTIAGGLSFGFSTDADGEGNLLVMTLTRGDRVLFDIEVPFGTSKCVAIFQVEFCSSYAADVTDIRRLSDAKPVKLHLKVDGEETESIVLVNVSSTNSSGEPSSDQDQDDADQTYSLSTNLYLCMMPIVLAIIS
jgi:hypothetical protein